MGGLISHNKTRQILCLTQTPGLLHETLGQGQVVDLFSQIGVAEPIDLVFSVSTKMSLLRYIRDIEKLISLDVIGHTAEPNHGHLKTHNPMVTSLSCTVEFSLK